MIKFKRLKKHDVLTLFSAAIAFVLGWDHNGIEQCRMAWRRAEFHW